MVRLQLPGAIETGFNVSFPRFGDRRLIHSLARLHTWEVKRLLIGLRALWNKATNHVALTFSEPGLSMDAKAMPNDKYRLQIQLGHDLTPSWHEYPDFPLEMDIMLSRNQLQEAIQDLSGQIETFPER